MQGGGGEVANRFLRVLQAVEALRENCVIGAERGAVLVKNVQVLMGREAYRRELTERNN